MSEFLIPLLSALLGGGMTYGAVWMENRHQRQLLADQERRAVNGYLAALRTEIACLLVKYEHRTAERLRATPAGAVFDYIWPVNHDYFTVYTANAGLLGRVPDGDLRSLIVETYTSAKGMLDSLAMNASLAVRLGDLRCQVRGPGDDSVKQEIERVRESMAGYATALKAFDQQLVDQAKALTEGIDAYLRK